MGRLLRNLFSVAILCLVIVGILAPPLAAKTAEPTLASRAWYWEEAQTQEITLPTGEKVTLETSNPFCPAAPGSLGAPEQTCAEGRLPVEVREGDYETPNKLSAVNFDLSLVPIGSTVQKFTVTFLEAKAGCYDSADEDENPNWCEETDPVNVEGHELQACLVNDFFGDGDARPYKEAPKFTCSETDPTAKRKEVEDKDGNVDHVWTFDLTEYAQGWIKAFTTNTSIMLTGKPPQGYQPGDTDPADTWRVVLMGPKAPQGKNGIQAKIVFEPGELEPPPPPPGGTTGGVTTGSSGVPVSSGSGSISTGGGSDFGSGSVGGGATAPADAGGETPAPIAAAGAEQTPQGLPAYVWLAVLAGIIAWSVFRSAVMESAKGIRPDGVLAQIQRLNTQRRGGEVVAAAVAGPSAFSSFLGGIKNGAGSLLGKLKLTRKG